MSPATRERQRFKLQREFALLSFNENGDSFVFHFAAWFFSARVSPFLSVRKMTELATNFLHKSDKLVFGPLVLVAPE